MKQGIWIKSIFIFLVSAAFGQDKFEYPYAYKGEEKDTIFSQCIYDPYRWFEKDSEQSLTNKWLGDQKNLFDSYQKNNFRKTTTFIHKLEKYRFADFNPMIKAGKYYFTYMYNSFYGFPSLYYKFSIIPGDEYELVNPSKFENYKDEDVSIADFSVSKDNELIALSLSRSGTDWREIRVMNISKAKVLPDIIKNVRYSKVKWYGNGFFYIQYEKIDGENSLNSRVSNQKIKYHKIGTRQEEDKVFFEVNDDSFLASDFDVVGEEKYLIVYSNILDKEEIKNIIYFFDLQNNDGPKEIIRFNKDIDYEVIEFKDNHFFLVTNENAETKKVIKFSLWDNSFKDVIPKFQNLLTQISLNGNNIVALYYLNGQFFLGLFDLEGKLLIKSNFAIGEDVQVVRSDINDHQVFFYVSSFCFPTVVYCLDLKKRKFDIVSKTEIRFDYSNYTTKYFKYQSKDGTYIPMYISYKKNTKINTSKTPVLLVGYGGFGLSTLPEFDPGYILFMDAGGVIAAPQIRGGGELGKEWHEKGKNLNKQNSFDDFISAAEMLITMKITNPEKIAINGGSNGGLLVGAVITQRPDLFKVAVPVVGLFDMIRYEKFGINYVYKEEYGTISKEDEFLNILKYSPLHNLKDGIKYPATLVVTSDHDDRVPPFHSYKFLATLQEKGDPRSPYLLLLENNAGHYGAQTINKWLYNKTMIYQFIFENLGMKLGYN